MLTDEEKTVLIMTAALWNALIALPAPHGHDNSEHMRDIHDIQNRVYARASRRALESEMSDAKP